MYITPRVAMLVRGPASRKVSAPERWPTRLRRNDTKDMILTRDVKFPFPFNSRPRPRCHTQEVVAAGKLGSKEETRPRHFRNSFSSCVLCVLSFFSQGGGGYRPHCVAVDLPDITPVPSSLATQKNKEPSQTDTQHMHVEVCHDTRVAHTGSTRARTWIRVRTTWHTPDACLHSRRVGRHQSMELSSCSAFDVTRKSAVFHVEIRPSLVRTLDT